MGTFECHRKHRFPTKPGTLVCPECGLRYRQEYNHWVMEDGPEKDSYRQEVADEVARELAAREEDERKRAAEFDAKMRQKKGSAT
jgi:uncharacterized Zn finger protein (UPF0148 family)